MSKERIIYVLLGGGNLQWNSGRNGRSSSAWSIYKTNRFSGLIMEKVLAEKFGCKIVERNSKLFIQYDTGQAASWIVENEITTEEAEKAMLNAESACQVILLAEKRIEPIRVK